MAKPPASAAAAAIEPGRDLRTAQAGAELQMSVNRIRDKFGLSDAEISLVTSEVLLRMLRRLQTNG